MASAVAPRRIQPSIWLTRLSFLQKTQSSEQAHEHADLQEGKISRSDCLALEEKRSALVVRRRALQLSTGSFMTSIEHVCKLAVNHSHVLCECQIAKDRLKDMLLTASSAATMDCSPPKLFRQPQLYSQSTHRIMQSS